MVDDPGTDDDSIWTMPSAGPSASSVEPGSGSLGSAEPTPRDRRVHRNTWRIVAGVGCLLIAAGAAWFAVTGDDDPDERPVGQALSTTPRLDETKVLEIQREVTSSGAIVPTTVPAGAEVKCAAWDDAVNYEPTDQARGVFIWSDFDGWHVRSAGEDLGTVTGRITGTVPPNLLPQEEPERVDATIVPESSDLYFTIRPGAEPQGIDFSAGCNQKAFTFELETDGTRIDPELVHLGMVGGTNEVPFTVSRTPEP